jgi:hypothetical protein
MGEASMTGLMGDGARAQKLISSVVEHARELGARGYLGWALLREGNLLKGRGHVSDALERYRGAEQVWSEAGFIPNLAIAKRARAGALAELGSGHEALAVYEEVAALERRLGDRAALSGVFVASAGELLSLGDVDGARERLAEARVELDALGEAPGLPYRDVQAGLAMEDADLKVMRDIIRDVRSGSEVPSAAEGLMLWEQDHLEEARSAFVDMQKESEREGWGSLAFRFAAKACAVDCSGEKPAAGATCLAEVFRKDQNAETAERAACLSEEALCRYRANDLAGAERAARDARKTLEHQEESLIGLRASIISARIAAARGESARAIPALRTLLATAESKAARSLGFDAALALGEAELRAGNSEGRARLLKLEEEAKSREFFRLARLAREALTREPELRAHTKR